MLRRAFPLLLQEPGDFRLQPFPRSSASVRLRLPPVRPFIRYMLQRRENSLKALLILRWWPNGPARLRWSPAHCSLSAWRKMLCLFQLTVRGKIPQSLRKSFSGRLGNRAPNLSWCRQVLGSRCDWPADSTPGFPVSLNGRKRSWLSRISVELWS